MQIDTPGIYDITMEAYHAHWPSLGSSGAWQIIDECPARFDADRRNPPKKSDALNFGEAAHKWTLEGEAWPGRHVVLPEDHDGRTKAGKERVAAIEAEGKMPLPFEAFEIIKAMRESLLAHPYAAEAFQGGETEKSMFWRDPEFGFWCKCRPDYGKFNWSLIVDYKTSASVATEDLQRSLHDFGYAQRASWYLDGIRALGLSDAPAYLWIFQEKKQPFLVRPVMAETVALEWGALLNRKAREIFARGLDTGIWPGYGDDILTLGLPAWAESRLRERSERGAFEVTYRPATVPGDLTIIGAG